MAASSSKSLTSIGFLTAIDHDAQGIVGAYLILNSAGRPLEFHCTTPVRANRAQQILYGPTLEPYLIGEQIGQTLLAKAKSKPMFVCTDLESALAVRLSSQMPVVHVCQPPVADTESNPPTAHPLGHEHPSEAPEGRGELLRFSVGRQHFAVDQAYPDDRQDFERLWQTSGRNLDLCEPFQRIQEAIQEARNGAAA